MRINLKQGDGIIGTAPAAWEVVRIHRAWNLDRHALDQFERVTAWRGDSLQAAFEAALAMGCVEPGKPLDLAAFNLFVRDAALRFDGMAAVRLGDGYTASQNAGEWQLTRDCGRGGNHAVKIATTASLAEAIAAAAWHASIRAGRTLTAPEVGPFMTGIAHRIVDGAMAGNVEVQR